MKTIALSLGVCVVLFLAGAAALCALETSEVQKLQELKAELNFSEWYSKTRGGRRVYIRDFHAESVVPVGVHCISVRLDAPVPTYRVECGRDNAQNLTESIEFTVRLFPSVEKAHEAMLNRFLYVSAPLSYLKEQWKSQEVAYGDVHFGRDFWATGNAVFELIGGSEHKELVVEVFRSIDKALTGSESRTEDTERTKREREQVQQEAELVRIRSWYEFDEWSSKLKIPGKEIRSLPAFEKRLAKYGRVRLYTSGRRSVSLALFPPGADAGSISISLHVLDSPSAAKEALLKHFALVTFPGPVYERPDEGEEHDLGDVCFFPKRGKRNRLYCARNNVFVTLKGSEPTEPADVLRLAREIDQLIVDSLVDIGAELPPGKIEEPAKPAPPGLPRELVAAMEQDDLDRLLSFVRRPEREVSRAAIDALAKTPQGRAALAGLVKELRGADRDAIISALGRAGTPDALDALRKMAETAQDPRLYEDAMEALLESMPEHEGRQFCLEEAEKLADNPDAQPDKLLFLVRGLRQDYDPPEVRLLRQILRKTNNERVREASLGTLSKWVTDAAEVREDVLRILEGHLKDESADVRATALRSLGESGDPRYVAVIVAALDDAHAGVRQQGAEAICTLLGWKRPELRSDQQLDAWLEGLKAALPPVLEALGRLEKATKQPGLW